LGLTLFADRLHDTLAAPDVANVAILAIVLVAIVGALLLFRRALQKASRSEDLSVLRDPKES
jgi:hypothetical protein